MEYRFRIKLFKKEMGGKWGKCTASSLWGKDDNGFTSNDLLFNLYKYFDKGDISLSRIFGINIIVNKIREYDANKKTKTKIIYQTKPIFKTPNEAR